MKSEPLPPLGVDGWFAPLGFDAFARSHLGKQVFTGHVPDPTLTNLARALAEPSPRALLDAHEGEVIAWFQGKDGRLRMPKVAPSAAKDLFDAGLTLYMRGLAPLHEVSRQVASTLGLPPESVRSGLFCNTANAETRAHFDRVDTFTIQLRGSKVWQLAPNDVVPSPLNTWATLEPVPPELQLQACGELPTDMPRATESSLAPGSLLYVPRGTWHRTWSGEPSCSLHIHVEPPIWANVVLDALRTRLIAREAWRGSAYGTSVALGTGSTPVQQLLREIAEIAETLGEQDVLPFVASASAAASCGETDQVFSRDPGASFAIERIDDGIAHLRLTVRRLPWSPTTRIEVPVELLPVCWRIQSAPCGEAFTAQELVSGSSTADDVEPLLDALRTAGFVRSATRAATLP